MRLMGALLLLGLAACASPWRTLGHGEAQLAEAAERAAWSPTFLTSWERFEKLTSEHKSHFGAEPFPLSSQQLVYGMRLYRVGDPTEDVDPPLKHCVVLVERGPEDQVEARVVTPDSYFQSIFRHLDGYDPL